MSRLGSRVLPALIVMAMGSFLFGPVAARAQGIGGALSNLLSGVDTSYNGPGYFSSEARGVYLFGGAEVRFPTQVSPTLLSVNPPYVYAGCGGISAYFGGFSYINGQQIEQLIKEIAQNSVGLVSMLAIKELCPQCADVIAEMQAIAQKASELSINSCQMSKYLIQKGAGLFGKSVDFSDDSQSKLAATEAGMGKSSGYLADVYNGISDADSFLQSLNNDIGQAEKSAGVNAQSQLGQEVLCKGGGECNTVWTLLGDSDLGGSSDPQTIWNKTFLMNVIGTKVVCPKGSSCPNIPPHVGYKIYPATLGFSGAQGSDGSMYNVYRLFLCGVNWQNAGKTTEAQEVITYYCQQSGQAANGSQSPPASNFEQIKVWQCGDPGLLSSTDVPCTNIVSEPLASSILANSSMTGYLPYVANILDQGVQEVVANQPLDNQVIALLQIVPAPLYQAINAAAVFPAAAEQTVMSMSIYTADLLVDEEIRHIARTAARLKDSSEIPQEQVEELYRFLGGMITQARQNDQSFITSINLQQTLMQQIREIDAAVAKETISQGLLGASRFGLAVTSGSTH